MPSRSPTTRDPLTRPGRARRRIGVAIDLALVALVAAVLAAVIVGRLVALTGRGTLVVAGGSMEPTIARGSAVVIERVAATDLRVGDIVSLRSGPAQAIFTHRIIRIVDRDGSTWIETRGDANADADPSLTPASQVLGRVSLTVPAIGYLVALLARPVGLVFVVSLGLILLVLGWLAAAPVRSGRDPAHAPVAGAA